MITVSDFRRRNWISTKSEKNRERSVPNIKNMLEVNLRDERIKMSFVYFYAVLFFDSEYLSWVRSLSSSLSIFIMWVFVGHNVEKFREDLTLVYHANYFSTVSAWYSICICFGNFTASKAVTTLKHKGVTEWQKLWEKTLLSIFVYFHSYLHSPCHV